jgi:hypothetical protein
MTKGARRSISSLQKQILLCTQELRHCQCELRYDRRIKVAIVLLDVVLFLTFAWWHFKA